jgi:hypothetical protein
MNRSTYILNPMKQHETRVLTVCRYDSYNNYYFIYAIHVNTTYHGERVVIIFKIDSF